MAINSWNEPTGEIGPLARRKLDAFARIEEDFAASFRFVQEVHGQRRFKTFPVADSVRYLHALYVCECKDRLLSIPKNIQRYEGAYCLELLRVWQRGETADVVAFIHRKLDRMPFAELTQEIEAAARAGDAALARRLTSGRMVLLNRNINLSHALEAIFALDHERLLAKVRTACARYGHTPDEIDRQQHELRSDLYGYAPSAALARRNMLLMNQLGPQVMDADGDRPGERTYRVQPPTSPVRSYAESAIPGAMTLTCMTWNNPRHLNMANPPERLDAPDTLGRYPLAPPDPTEPMPGPIAQA